MSTLSRRHNLASRLWHVLSSTRLAISLLCTAVLVTVLASFFPQMPLHPDARETWLQAVRLRFGPATNLIQALGLFDAYHSGWFVALLVALALNTVFCTAQRAAVLWRSLARPIRAAMSEAFYVGSSSYTTQTIPPPQGGTEAFQAALTRCGFSVYVEQRGEITYLYGERARWTRAATAVSHVAAALLVLALCAQPAFGGKEAGMVAQASYDPTFIPAVVSLSVFLVTTVISLWAPHQQLWLRVDPDEVLIVSSASTNMSQRLICMLQLGARKEKTRG